MSDDHELALPDMGTFSSSKKTQKMSNRAKLGRVETSEPKFTLMKKIIALLAVATGIGFLSPSESSARDYCHNDRRIVSYHPCGAPIYSVYQICGRDRYGNPVGHWVTLNTSHSSCRACYSRSSHHDHDHGHSHHSSSHGPGFPFPPHHGAAASFFFGR